MKTSPLLMGNVKITPLAKFTLCLILYVIVNLSSLIASAQAPTAFGSGGIYIDKTIQGLTSIVSNGQVQSQFGGFYDCIPNNISPQTDGIVDDFYSCETGQVRIYNFPERPINAPNLNFIGRIGNSPQVQLAAVSFYDGATQSQLLYKFLFTQANQYPFQFSGISAGTYWVEVSYNYTLGSSPTVLSDRYCRAKLIVTEVPPLSFNISNSTCSPNQICFTTGYTTSQLQNINWDFGDGFTGTSSSNTTCHTYTSQGTYNVTLTYGEAFCQFTKQATVTPPIAISLSATNINDCRSNNSTSVVANVSNGVAPYTYQWQQATGITAGNNATASLNNNTIVNGTYGVTVTDAYDCQATASYIVNMVNCCSGTSITCNSASKELTYNNVNISKIYQDVCGTNNSINMAALPTNAIITINGVLTIDGVYSILNSNNNNSSIRFNTNGSILINPNQSLSINNSYLLACGSSMWTGIKLMPGGTLNVTNNSTIADAIIAIDGGTTSINNQPVTGIGNFTLSGSRFFRNWVSFNTPRAPAATSTINGCSFVCDPANSLTGTLLAPHLGKRPAVGLFLNFGAGAYWNITNQSGGTPNTFDGLNNAIYVHQSNVRVNNNLFRNIRNYNAVNPSSGCAVYCISTPFTTFGNDVWVQTNTSNSNAAFLNCDYGVYVTNAKSTVLQNKLENVKYGIFASACPNRRLQFNNNVMTGTEAGITFNSVLGSTSLPEANSNNISIVEPTAFSPNTYGIAHFEATNSVVNCSGGASDRTCRPLIELNTINNGRYGVYINNAYGTRVTSNTINLTNNVSTNYIKAGIFVSGSTMPLITINSIFGNIGQYDESGSASSANRRVGVRQINSTAELCNNSFNNIGYASQFLGGCNGTQLKQNQFNSTRYGVVLANNGATEGRIGQQGDPTKTHGNIFAGPFNNPSSHRTFCFNSDGSFSIFRVINPTITQQPEPNGSNTILSPIIKQAATTSTPWSCSTQPTGWKSVSITQGDLFAKEVAEGEADGYMEFGFEASGKYVAERDLYNRLEADNGLLNSKPLYQDFYAQKQQEVVGEFKRFDEQLLQLADTALLLDSIAFEEKINEAIVKNNTIVSTETWEQNRKAMNELYLRTVARSQTTFSASEKQIIYNMAARCPYSDGEAVYLARTMYNLIEPTAAFDDDEICNAVASFKKEQARKAKVQPLSVSVSPNPASTQVDIVIKGSQENMLLTITNNVGEVVSQSEVNHYVTVGVSDLPNGLYYLTFIANTREQIVSKLIIAK